MAASPPHVLAPAADPGAATGIEQDLAGLNAFVCSGPFFALLEETDAMSRTEKERFFDLLSGDALKSRGIRPPHGITVEICSGPSRQYLAPGRPILVRVHKELPDGMHKLTVAFDYHEGHSWLPGNGS